MHEMGIILEKQELRMSNVLSRRGKFSMTEVQAEMEKIGALLGTLGVSMKGNIVTATFATYNASGGTVIDAEILVPLDGSVNAPEGYTFKPEFRLVNALKVRHADTHVQLDVSVEKINAYIAEKKLTPITPVYNVMMSNSATQGDMAGVMIDIYVGVSPNIL